MSILIVDDELSIRDVLTDLIEGEGYSTVAVSDGNEALSYLGQAEEPPCLILLDLMMPGLNGWEFRDMQMRDPAIAPIPVAIISAGENLKEEAYRLGAEDYLVKPLDIDKLMYTIEQYCAGCL